MNGDDNCSRPRVGLSQYTANRLAELRARRAELDADYNDYKAKSRSDTSATSPTSATSAASSSSSISSSDLLESYRARRGLPSNGTSSPTKPEYSVSNDTSNGHATQISPTKQINSIKLDSSSCIPETKLSNINANSVVAPPSSGLAKTSPLNTGSSFSKADYGSSRGSQLDQIKSSSVVVNRSNSVCVGGMSEDDDECVGFASLPEQVHRKAVKRGFDFTLMVVGETGLGKSTLISSLFLNPQLYKDRQLIPVQESLGRTVDIEKKYMEIEEKGVKLRLTIVDTPGFNDSLDAEQSWRPIEQYISQQFDQYFKDESGLNRKHIKDYRVHCCLYFVSPYGYGLRPIDVQFMKRLHDKVNIVPIIAKSDTLTPVEVKRLKEKILDQVDEHGIHIYEFPDCDSDEDEEFKKQDSQLKSSIPFAVIGSNTVVEVGSAKVRGRLYPWGVVEVDNPDHCDFCKLRMMLISTHMQDLKDVTRDVHYENFRAQHIKAQLTKNQRERNKLKRDSSPNFESIMDNSQVLEAKDAEIRRMQAMIAQMQAELHTAKSNGSSPVK